MRNLSARVLGYITVFEFFSIFIVIPYAIWIGLFHFSYILVPLYLVAAYAAIWLTVRGNFKYRQFWFGEKYEAEKNALAIILKRVVIVALLLWLLTYVLYPEKLFNLPLEKPAIWLLLMVLYPLLSVYPQELLYRAFFFRRYSRLFHDRFGLIGASAVAFGGMHIVFGNVLAIFITLAGGYLIADTYSRTRSMRMVFLEHSLYGCLIFTLGLGEFFLFGNT